MDWSSRPVQPALSTECLSVLLDDTALRSGGLLFTSAAAGLLDEVARWQRLEDLAWCGKVTALSDLQASADACPGAAAEEFVADEVALALGVGGITADNVLHEALEVIELPGLLTAVQTGRLSVRHVKAVLRALRDYHDLTAEQRNRLVTLLLGRLDSVGGGAVTPGQLSKQLARLALTMDLTAAEGRKARKDADRAVHFYPAPDGQAVLHATGPAELIAMVQASLDATLPLHADPSDTRSKAAREFDLFLELLTGSTTPGKWHASVLVPFHTAIGGNLELAELPGLGPVLPSTAHTLLQQATRPGTGGGVTRISLDEHGSVIHVDTPRTHTTSKSRKSSVGKTSTAGKAGAAPTDGTPGDLDLTGLLAAFTVSPAPRDLSSSSFRIPDRLRRLVQARDQHCTFPLCNRPASKTDLDHRIPWPYGSTSEANLHSLCRHHHRAKQASFTAHPRPDGATIWTTRGGWQFTRPPTTY